MTISNDYSKILIQTSHKMSKMQQMPSKCKLVSIIFPLITIYNFYKILAKKRASHVRVARVHTLWCQIRPERSLLGPVLEYPLCLFLWIMFFSFCTLWFLFRPCFSLQFPCGFYSDLGFSKCYFKSANVKSTLKLVIPLWFVSGPRFSGLCPMSLL